MAKIFEIENMRCARSSNGSRTKIAYVLYPMEFLADWIEQAASRHDVTIVVITGFDWDNDMSPWPAPGVPAGSPDFEGNAAGFLKKLQKDIIPVVEADMQLASSADRTLVGVSMSGLFTTWQWMVCDTFGNIASLSGSFWYSGFVDWMKAHVPSQKNGKGLFLLGDKESQSRVKAFQSVAVETQQIIELLRQHDPDIEFLSVPGNHYANPIPRLEAAFSAIFAPQEPDKKL